jgi:hypothetical protein
MPLTNSDRVSLTTAVDRSIQFHGAGVVFIGGGI